MTAFNDLFNLTCNDVLPAQGSILISEPFLQDTYFQRSVVLLVEHAKEGSMGFVLNKKTDLSVNSFFSGLEQIPEMPIFLGGPVSSNRLFFIHTLGMLLPGAIKINEYLYFDGNFNTLLQYIRSGQPVEGRIKFFLGYSGWEEGQLNNEMSRNSWVVSQASNRSIMLANGEDFWKRSLESLGSRYKTWTKYPKNPYWN